jgi:hypothetical protein
MMLARPHPSGLRYLSTDGMGFSTPSPLASLDMIARNGVIS